MYFFSFLFLTCYWNSFGVVSQDVGKRENVYVGIEEGG
jgi:hypothetical protein